MEGAVPVILCCTKNLKSCDYNKKENRKQPLTNIVGVIGESKKDEYVVFSAHYDHLGYGKPDAKKIHYITGNDDASGTTAVIILQNILKH